MILPTRVGGDVAGILNLRGANNSLAKSASSVLVERLFGISTLFIFAVVAALLRLPLASEIPAVPVALVRGGGGLSAIISFTFSHFLARFFVILHDNLFHYSARDTFEHF